MWQDILTFWNSLPSFVPLITAGGALLTAVFTGLLYRGRHEPPAIVTHVRRSNSKAGNSDLEGRYISFYMPPESEQSKQSKWLIEEVRIAKHRCKWIAVAGEGQRNDFGEFIGYPLGGDWTNRIRYDPPVYREKLRLHPDAPKHLRFSFRVCLRYRFRVKRWVHVIPWTSPRA